MKYPSISRLDPSLFTAEEIAAWDLYTKLALVVGMMGFISALIAAAAVLVVS